MCHIRLKCACVTRLTMYMGSIRMLICVAENPLRTVGQAPKCQDRVYPGRGWEGAEQLCRLFWKEQVQDGGSVRQGPAPEPRGARQSW